MAVPWINLIDHSAVTGQEQIPKIKITHLFTGKMTGVAIVRRRNDNIDKTTQCENNACEKMG